MSETCFLHQAITAFLRWRLGYGLWPLTAHSLSAPGRPNKLPSAQVGLTPDGRIDTKFPEILFESRVLLRRDVVPMPKVFLRCT